MTLLNVITSLRKLNAQFTSTIETINNLIDQIECVQSLEGNDLNIRALALLYLSLSEEVEELQTSLDQLASYIQTIQDHLANLEVPLSTTFLQDITALLVHLQSVYDSYQTTMKNLHRGPIKSSKESNFTVISLIDANYDLVVATQRIRADLSIDREVVMVS